ncbi:AOR, partial [Symbiodinium necroappetens]
MGSDIVAVVEAVQPSCRRLNVGDRVWADIGAVVETTKGRKGKENGAFAPFAVALESQLGAMPKNVSVLEAAALPKVSLTSYKALKWYGGAPYGQDVTVLILGGSGGCGSTGIQLAKAWGATTIITTTSVANELYVRRLGADRVIDYTTQNWWEVLSEGTVDVVYDTAGEAGTGDRAMALLRQGGYFVTIAGALPQKPRADIRSSTFINSATNLQNFQLLDELRDLVDRGHLRMPELQTFQLADILKAFDASAAHHVRGKLVIQMPAARSPPKVFGCRMPQRQRQKGEGTKMAAVASVLDVTQREGGALSPLSAPIYTGPWKNDEPGTGYADILYPSGHRYKGKVCDGCRDGKGSLWHQGPGLRAQGEPVRVGCASQRSLRLGWRFHLPLLRPLGGEGEPEAWPRPPSHTLEKPQRQTRCTVRASCIAAMACTVASSCDHLRCYGEDLYCRARDAAEAPLPETDREVLSRDNEDTLSYYDGEWEEDQPQGTGTFVDEHGQEFCDREFEQGDLIGSRLTGRSKRIFSVKTISSVSLQKPSSSKVLPGPKKEIPHAGTVCQNAGLLPEEEPAQTRVIDVGSGVSNARSRPAHCGPEDASRSSHNIPTRSATTCPTRLATTLAQGDKIYLARSFTRRAPTLLTFAALLYELQTRRSPPVPCP